MEKEELPIVVKENRLVLDSDGFSPIEELDLEKVCDIIRSTTSTLYVSLKLKGINNTGATKLAFAILDSKGQITLNLDANEIDDGGAFVLLNAITRIRYFVHINISNNKITDKTTEDFAYALESFKHGAYINLSSPLTSNSRE